MKIGKYELCDWGKWGNANYYFRDTTDLNGFISGSIIVNEIIDDIYHLSFLGSLSFLSELYSWQVECTSATELKHNVDLFLIKMQNLINFL